VVTGKVSFFLNKKIESSPENPVRFSMCSLAAAPVIRLSKLHSSVSVSNGVTMCWNNEDLSVDVIEF
jgi:hypothetical protein